MQPCLVTAGVLAGALLAAAQSTAVPKTLSVCELFKNLRSHAGEMISVRGTLYSGREVSALGGNCDTRFVTKYSESELPEGLPRTESDYLWPTALNLADSSWVEKGAEPVDFRTDEESVQRVFALLRREKASGQDIEILVTVVGKLRMKDRYQVGKTPDGALLADGYGHLGTYPAQLVIKTMLDPVVKLKR
jgi:hypothetical protein